MCMVLLIGNFPYVALIFPSSLMIRLWHRLALILLFVGAIHGQSRTGYIFLFTIYIINVRQFISGENFSFEMFLHFFIVVYTFESASHLSAFTASPTSTIERTTERYKDATHSMKWTWASGDSITHAFTSNVSI